MKALNLVNAINLTLEQEMKHNKKIVLYGEDVGKNGGVFRVTEGLIKKFPNRVFNSPLAETGIVGTAIGMAAYGLKPIVEIQFEGFLFSVLDQLINHASRLRNRTRGKLSVPLVIRCPIGGGIKALEHHSDSPEAYFAQIPGLKVVFPSNPYDAKGLLTATIADPDPVLFFEPKRLYRSVKINVPNKRYLLPLGQAAIIKEGTDLTVVSYGASIKDCIKTVLILNSKYSIELIDLRTIRPLDQETILTSVKKTGRLVVVNEAQKFLSLGAEIVAMVCENTKLKSAPVRVNSEDTIFPLSRLEKEYLINEQKIVTAIEKVMRG